jgi:hypothetical protein
VQSLHRRASGSSFIYAALGMRAFDMRDRLAPSTALTLALSGDRDALFPLNYSREIRCHLSLWISFGAAIW